MDAIRQLIEAARREAERLERLAQTADDRGACVIAQQAQKWKGLAYNAERALQQTQ